MKIELVDSQGHAIDVPNDLEHLSPDGWATFKPVSVEAGRTIVGVRVTMPLKWPEHFDADGVMTPSIRGLDVK